MITEEQRLQKDRVRVFELARELDMESKDLMALCRRHGIELKNQLSNVSTEQRDQIIEVVKRGPTATSAPPRAAGPVIPAVINRKVQTLETRRPTLGKPTPASAPPKLPEIETSSAVEAPAIVAPAAKAPSPEIPPVAAPLESVAAPHLPVESVSQAVALRTPAELPAVKEPTDGDRVVPHVVIPPAPSPGIPDVAATAKPSVPLAPPRTKVPDLGSSRPAGDSNRAPRTLRPGGNRPVLRQTGSPSGGARTLRPGGKQAELKKPVEKIMQPLVAFTKEHLEKVGERPLRPEDVMRPGGAIVPPVIEDDDDAEAKKKGGSKDRPGSVSGRKQRQEERNKRAAERKGRSQELDVQLARGVTDVDVLERPRSGSLKHKLKKKKPTEQRKGRVPVVLPITVRSLSEAIGMRAGDVQSKLIQTHGLDMRTATINSTIDPDLAILFALEHGCELEVKRAVDAEETLLTSFKKEDSPESLLPRARSSPSWATSITAKHRCLTTSAAATWPPRKPAASRR